MAKKSGSLDNWRNYFRASNSDIFDIIEHAILVAASDCPQEFRLRRDRIAETLFSCKLAKCLRCDSVVLSVPGDGGGDEDDDEEGCKIDGYGFEAGGSKESKVNSSRDDQAEMNVNQMSNYSYGEAEALTDEIEEESQIVGEVLRIKEILDNCQDESDSGLFDSLRRLQLMDLSVDKLRATEIGKSVNALRKHASKEIRHLARTLIEVWKDMVDEWVNATAAIGGAEGTPESVDPSVVDEEEEEGLPSPPLDEVFLATQTTMELSQFFDGMDDDGNPRNSSGEFNKNRQTGRKPSRENQNVPKRNPQVPHEPYVPAKDKKSEEMKKQGPILKKQAALVKSHRLSNTESGLVRPTKANVEHKVGIETKFQQRSEKSTLQKKPVADQQDKSKCLDDAARLEAAKRRLHERYQQAENAKRQRTIQVMELHDLPKQGLGGHRNANMRPGNHNRHWANGRR
ncbi:probable mediator of RNA polymerase II transcription subunit 26b [Actinidia eriantha]|uniref:probable mediator of RNA polymerase II transcription subunit 26b n=1 Tax=Actinidia eriantha TaxID=165200 RepID=UPI00258AA872|nr:probable mediator of RNA polymerase II transcription subunit 26b [Actinidia eriantha]